MIRYALSGGTILSSVAGGSFLHPYLNGSQNVVVNGVPITEGYGLLAALAIALALALGLTRLYLDGMLSIPSGQGQEKIRGFLLDRGDGPPSKVDKSYTLGRRYTKRVAVFGVVGLLVSAAALGGVGGQFAATDTASAEWVDCNFTDSLIGAAYNTVIGADSDCRWSAGTSADYDNITATDAYSSALALRDSTESYTATTGNFMENTRTVAYSKAKIQILNDLNDGVTASNAKIQANNTIEDYYSRIQMQVIKDWNAKITQVEYLDNQSDSTIAFEWYDGTGTWKYEGRENFEFETYNKSLINGTSVPVKYVRISTQGDHAGPIGPAPLNDMVDIRFRAVDPDDGSEVTIISTTQYRSADQTFSTPEAPYEEMLVNQTMAQSQQVKANMGAYVDGVFAEFSAGEISSIDLVRMDPSVIANEASTSLNSTGYYGHAAIMLASIGASGNINISHTVTAGDGTVLSGTLYYTGDDVPASGWENGVSYNLADYNGTFYMAVQKDDGNATIVDLSNYGTTFTITEATNTQTGEEVNTTKVQTYTYDSTNASALAEEIDRLRELRESYQNQQASAGGGGWLDGLGGAQTGAIAALLAVVALLALTRD